MNEVGVIAAETKVHKKSGKLKNKINKKAGLSNK